jgi:hypothetical protein
MKIIFEMFGPNLTIDFLPLPTSLDDLPNVHFGMRRPSTVFFDTPQLPDSVMDLTARWAFNHQNRRLSFTSRDGVLPPTVETYGSGPVFRNHIIVEYFDKYCLCERDCSLCSSPTVNFSSLDATVIGSPMRELKYELLHTTKTVYPVFSLELFSERSFMVVPLTANEHAGVADSAREDSTVLHAFSSLTLHLPDSVVFPFLSLHRVTFACTSQCELKAGHITSDFTTLYFRDRASVTVPAPPGGFSLDARSLPFVPILFMGPRRINVSGVVLTSYEPSLPELSVTATGPVSLFLSPRVRKRASADGIPRVRLILEESPASVAFPGEQWPDGLLDITAKVLAVHGSSPLSLEGACATTPAVLACEGSGPVYINGILPNFHSRYCVCEGVACDGCHTAVGFTASAIARSAAGNPHRLVEYGVRGSTPRRRPLFALRAFVVAGGTAVVRLSPSPAVVCRRTRAWSTLLRMQIYFLSGVRAFCLTVQCI